VRRAPTGESSERYDAMPLALELASDFYDVATTVAVTLVTRGLSESTMIEASWREIFKRRFPCLAPHFENPSAPRALVQSLLSAKPPQCSPRPLLPDCPTDAAGRALPPRAGIVFAAQLSVRGATPLSHRPLLHVSGKPNGNKNPVVVAELLLGPEDGDWKELCNVLSTPASITMEEDEDGGCNTDAVWRMIVEANEAMDEKMRQEIYVVAGDAVWRMDTPCRCSDNLTLANTFFHDFFEMGINDEYELPSAEMPPHATIICDYRDHMRCVWFLGEYMLSHRYEWGDVEVEHTIFSARIQIAFAAGNEDRYLSALLATASPVRIE